MTSALARDQFAIDHLDTPQSEPVLYRAKLLPHVQETLLKKAVSLEFLELRGLDILASWLNPLSPSSKVGKTPSPTEETAAKQYFPLITVAKGVFTLLDTLPIETRHLEDSPILHTVSSYVRGECEDLRFLSHTAKQLTQKWKTRAYNLSYEYDRDGFHEQKERDLKQRLFAIKNRDQSNADEDLITRGPNNEIIMQRSNTQRSHFDFIEKPDTEENLGNQGSRLNPKAREAREKFTKAFQMMVKNKKATAHQGPRITITSHK